MILNVPQQVLVRNGNWRCIAAVPIHVGIIGDGIESNKPVAIVAGESEVAATFVEFLAGAA